MHRRLFLGAFTLVAVVVAGAGAGCSLISTSDLTGPPRCTSASDGGPDCTSTSTVADASLDAKATTDAACAADVQTDSANCGSCGHTCGGGQMCSAGTCVAGCPGNIIYVAGTAGGSDNNDGCTIATTKKTIGSALAFAKSTKLPNQEIHVCKGTYTENELVLDFPVSVLGGWDCVIWTHNSTNGYPTFNTFDRTVIEPDPGNMTGETVAISGLTSGEIATLDGFTIYGPQATVSAMTSSAVFAFGGGTSVISNNDLEGAAASNARTFGVLVSLGSDPEITNNTIHGGGGQDGSTGIDVNGGAVARIHDNVISGGAGMYSIATGVEAANSGPLVGAHAIVHNTITGGNGAYDGVNVSAIGVAVNNSVAEILDNVISGGTGGSTGTTGGVAVDGVFVNGSGAFATVAGNLVEGGTASGGATQSVNGVVLFNSASGWIVNNAVHALATTPATESVFAVDADHCGTVTIEQNTLYGSAAALRFDGAETISATNNLLLGESSVGSIGVLFQNCTNTGLPTMTLVDNAFVGFGPNILQTSTTNAGACSGPNVTSVAAMEASIKYTASGNRRVVDDCSAESAARCFSASACPIDLTSGATCVQTVIATWDATSQGGVDLVDDTRTWKLAPNAPCLVTQGGGSVLPNVADAGGSQTGVDVVPVMRTAPTSLGAYESDVSCSN